MFLISISIRLTKAVNMRGVWIAYHHDWSAAMIFDNEVGALRYALDNHMSVTFWEFGTNKPD